MRAVGWPRGIDRRPPRRGHSDREAKEEKTLAAERDSLSSVGFWTYHVFHENIQRSLARFLLMAISSNSFLMEVREMDL